MKLIELISSNIVPIKEQQLDEINLKHAAAAGALALSTGMGGQNAVSNLPTPEPTRPTSVSYIDKTDQQKSEPNTEPEKEPEIKKEDPKILRLADKVLKKYRIDPELATEIVKLAKKHERKYFPKAEDLLAIIGIESSFNPNAVSGLAQDPAVGLTQIRPNIWGLDANSLKDDMDQQIAASANILAKYRKQLDNTEDAVHAYNVGITAFQRGDYNPNYVEKFKNERKIY